MREYLDKQKLLMELNDKYHDMSAMPASYYAGFQYAIKLIEKLHVSEEVAPVVHAKWAEVMFRDRFNARYWEYLCSSCNRYANREYDYCPNCGAKMDLEEE